MTIFEILYGRLPWITEEDIKHKSQLRYWANLRNLYLTFPHSTPEYQDYNHLIYHMLNREHEYRYSIKEIVTHPAITKNPNGYTSAICKPTNIHLQLVQRSTYIYDHIEQYKKQLIQIQLAITGMNLCFLKPGQIISIHQIFKWVQQKILYNIQKMNIEQYLKNAIKFDTDVNWYLKSQEYKNE